MIGIAAGACLALLAAVCALLYTGHRVCGWPAPLACLPGPRKKPSDMSSSMLAELTPKPLLPVGSRMLQVRQVLPPLQTRFWPAGSGAEHKTATGQVLVNVCSGPSTCHTEQLCGVLVQERKCVLHPHKW